MVSSIPSRGRREGYRVGGPASVKDLAEAEVRRRILTGTMPMGSHIREQALADEIGIGRAGLREALRSLERDGLVVHVPRSGSTVVRLTVQDAYEVVTLRECLERLAVKQGVPCAHPDRLARLRDAVEQMRANAAGGDNASAPLDGIAVHRAFIGLAHNSKLEAAFAVIAYPLAMLMGFNRAHSAAEETLVERAERHLRLLRLVEEGDPRAVLEELDSHPTHRFLLSDELETGSSTSAALEWAGRLRTAQ
ncbi:GntR family transcriptional regulator [uncultured Aeromicrobium sp.]|uniref:GntR family transcriptional regulator n=1 Tax=uncultured Aeromicrobium sp. TaxID=337820 RepID=UPI0025D36B37|nr:GntR family transcriptional regulator [uncultured Aeromicrobium sp.]